MKFFISLLVVFMLFGFVSAPAMACDHDCGNCSHSDTCTGDHDDGEFFSFEGDPDQDQDDGDGHGDCDGDHCQI